MKTFEWVTPSSEGSLQVPGANLHWLNFEAGKARGVGSESPIVLVLLHYFGGSAQTWQPVLQTLGGKFRCVSVDLRGFGQSTLAAGGGPDLCCSAETMANDVRAIIEHLRLKRYSLVGHSMGGKVALRLAADAKCPPGLTGLILLAPSPPTPEPMAEAERQRLLAGWGMEADATKTLSKTTAKKLPIVLAHVTVLDVLSSSPEAWRAWLETGSRENLSSLVGLIHVPVVLAAGEKDKAITPELLRTEIADRLPDARPDVIVIDGAAHLLPLEAPEAVADLITKAVGGWRERL